MIQRKMDKFFERVCLLLLFLFAISFLNLGGYIVCVAFFVFLLVVARYPLLLDRNFIILLIYAFCYFVNYSIHWEFGVKELIWYFLAPWWCYLCGKWFVVYAPGKDPMRALVVTLAAGFFAHGMLNVYAYIDTYGMNYVLNTTYRITVDFWRGNVISVTASSLYYVPLMALAIGYLFYGGRKHMKVLAWLVIIMGALANILYANRTAFVIIAVLFALGIGTKLFQKNSVRMWIWFLIGIVVFAVCWSFDIGGIKTWIMNLRVAGRFAESDTSRFDLWKDFLTGEWWQYPLGGEKVGARSVHNLWLDTLRTIGIIPFLLLLVFTFLSFGDLHRFCANGPKRVRGYVYMILGIMLSCSVEPIMSANPYYVMIWIMVVGGYNGSMVRSSVNVFHIGKEEQG